jgi:TolB-like protein/Tfp pilus assembly protein PilF
MPSHRQLAAIMFTDIEGYTATMQRNEEQALFLRDRHRDVLQEKHAEYNGRIIQYYGDGTLSIFHSAVEAVTCALEMQQQFCQLPKVPVRIGLHIGDIILNDNHVVGDGVNLASRIESMSVAGAVLLSDKVKDEIRNHPEFNVASMGVYKLKNVERQVEVFALANDGIIIPDVNALAGKGVLVKAAGKRVPAAHKTPPPLFKHSIAVLPFHNMSNDPEQDYFSEGVAEEILNSLSGLKQLKVAGRASSFQFRGSERNLREIGEKLGVRTVLEGSVRRQANRIRVTVQLVSIQDGYQLWSERYDRNLDDIFAVQDEIALSVTEKLKLTLLENEKKKIRKAAPHNTEAYELYLKGRFYLNRRGGSIMKGIKYFQLAVDLDPEYSLAHTGLADAHLLAASYGLVYPKDAGIKARDAAQKAIELDPTLCEPYSSLGFYYTCFEWNWELAERYFQKSLSINPKYAQAHYWYGLDYLTWAAGDFEQAEYHGKLAIELEPLSSICYGIYGPILHAQGKFRETIEVCQKGIAIDPYAFTCNLYAGLANIFLGNFKRAVQIFEKFMELSNKHPFVAAALCIAYSYMGEMNKARAIYEDLVERGKSVYMCNTMIAISAAQLGDLDTAFEYLEKGREARDPIVLSIRFEQWVPQELKADPRFKTFIEKFHFPEPTIS